MKKINKLVRDKIPGIIKADGKTPITRTLGSEEFLAELDRKLEEEKDEFLEEYNVYELADILEIIHAYCYVLDITFDELQKIRQEKAESNGGFNSKVFLEGVDE